MSRSLRILQIANVRWYNACAYYAVTLSLGLQRKGHQVIFLGDPNSPAVKKAKDLGIETFDKFWLSTTNTLEMAYAVKKIAEIIEQKKIDIINVHRGEAHFLSALAKKIAQRKVILIRTRGDVRAPQPHIFNKILYGKWTDGVIATCQIIEANYIGKLNINKNEVFTILAGIDEKYFPLNFHNENLKDAFGIKETEYTVGMVGRLSPVKGHRYFIESANFVLKKFPLVKFIIAGEDAQIQMNELKKLCKKLQIENNFIFLGRVKDIREVITLFDIGVVASIGSETICRVALEYMAMGKPVVATDVNAIPEVVKNNLNGIIVPPNNAEKMGEAILELLQDKEKKEKMGQEGRKLVEKEFSLDNFAQKTEEVYLHFLKKIC